MERAGNGDTDPDAERRGLGTPATRAAVIEKLVKGGFAERKGKQLIPTVDELEAKVKAGETISLVDLANAVKADKERGKEAKPEKKPSIRAQLRADKEKAQKKNAKQKSQDLERS